MGKAWEELESAEYLFKGGYFNDSASHSYYAMFFAAKAILSLKEIYPTKHSGVISQFGLQFVKDGPIDPSYGHMLNLAKELRERADYDVEKRLTEEEADDLLVNAKRFVEHIEKVLSEISSSP